MNAAAAAMRRVGWRWKVGIGVGAIVLLIVVANVHLVYVAVTSQPDCVAHLRAGEAAGGGYSAAKSSCRGATP